MQSVIQEKNIPPDERLRYRRRSKLLLEILYQHCLDYIQKALPKALLTKAARYFVRYYPELMRFCDDGHLPICNNLCERMIRKFVIGRKAWLFSASEHGARSSAVLYSLVLSCINLGVPVSEYLEWVITEIAIKKNTDYYSLLPTQWNKFNS